MELTGTQNSRTGRYNKVRNVNVFSNVKEVYGKLHPRDTMGNDMNPDIAFVDLLHTLRYGKDFYGILGVSDSLIRERLFAMLAKLVSVDYDVIYETWLGKR